MVIIKPVLTDLNTAGGKKRTIKTRQEVGRSAAVERGGNLVKVNGVAIQTVQRMVVAAA